MSRNIDTDIVELRFDNRNFEKNVKTSQNTLDKFKKSINFDSAQNSIMQLSAAFKSVTLGNIESSLASLESRFSAAGIVGMRVIQNLTDSAMGLINRVNNFVVSGIKNGGISRAMNLENANFQLLGLLKTEDKVNAVMQNVNDSVDGTAYSLDAAASVASQLAASGMEAGDDMFKSLRAVAGVAAMTNSEYSDIGRIFTQVAGQGRLMGDQLLQLSGRGMNAAATLAEYLGTDEAAVRDMVSAGAIDFQTFADAMDDAFGEHAKKANETFNGAMSNIKSALGRIGALFVAPLIKQNGPLVTLFNNIRVKVNEIKDAVVPLADVTTKKINQIIKRLAKLVDAFDLKKPLNAAKNALSIFGSKWNQLETRINSAGISTDDFQKKLIKVGKTHGVNVKKMIKESGSLGKAIQNSLSGDKNLDSKLITETLQAFKKELPEVSKSADTSAKKLEYFQKVVNQVWRGDFKNGEERVKALTKAGYDYNQVQKLVNKTIDGHKLTLEDLSDVELKNVGYTNEEIKAIRKLAKEAEKSGTPINELIADLSNPNSIKGSAIDSAKNILSGLKKLLKVTKNAFGEIFPAPTGASLLNIAVAIEKVTEKLDFNEKTGKKLQRTLKGLFALVDMISYLLGGGLKVALKVISKALGIADVDILSITASLGDFIVKIRDWIRENTHFEEAINEISEFLGKGIIAFKAWIKELKKSDNIPRDIIKGLANGIKSMASFVIDAIKGLAQDIIDKAKEVLDIHSPSKEFFSIGVNIVQGLIIGIESMIQALIKTVIAVARIPIDFIGSLFGSESYKEEAKKHGSDLALSFGDGIKESVKSIIEIVKSVINKVLELIKSVDISQILALVVGAGIYKTINNIADAISGLTAPLKGLGNFLTGMGKSLEANAIVKKSKAALNLAKSVMILAAALYLIAQVDPKRLWESFGAISALAGVLTVLSIALSKWSGDAEGGSMAGLALFVIAISGAILLLAVAMEKLSSVEDLEGTLKTLGWLGAGLLGFMLVLRLIGKAVSDAAGTVKGLAVFLISVGVAMLLMVAVIKMTAGMSVEDITKGTTVVAMFTGLIAALVAITKHSGDKVYQVGFMMLGVASSMMIMLGVVQLAAMMDEKKLKKGLLAITVMTGLVAALVGITKFAGNKVAGVGVMMVGVSMAFLTMTMVLAIVGNLDPEKAKNGLKCMAVMTLLISALIAVSSLAGPNAAKAGTMLVTISGAMIAMAALIFILGSLDVKTVKQGTACVLAVGILFAAFMGLTKLVNTEAIATIVTMVVALGLLIGAMVALTFIDTEKLIPAVVAVTLVIASLAGLTVAVAQVKRVSKTIQIVGAMIVMVGALAALVWLVSNLKSKPALKTVWGMSVLIKALAEAMFTLKESPTISAKTLGSMAVMGLIIAELGVIMVAISWLSKAAGMGVIKCVTIVKSLKALLNALIKACIEIQKAPNVTGKDVKKVAAMGLVMGEVGGIMVLLGWLVTATETSIGSLIGVAVSLGTLMLALSASMALIEKAPSVGKKSIVTLALMGLIIAEFGLILTGLSAIATKYNINGLVGMAAAIGLMLMTLAASFRIASGAKVSAKQVGTLILMGVVLMEIAFVIKLLGTMKAQSAIGAAGAIGIIILALSTSMIPLSLAGQSAGAAMKGIGLINAFILSLTLTFAAIGALFVKFPGLLDGLKMLTDVAAAIGTAIGTFMAKLEVAKAKVKAGGISDIVQDALLHILMMMPLIKMIVAQLMPIIKSIIAALAPILEQAVDFLFDVIQKAVKLLMPVIGTLMVIAEKVLAQFVNDIAPALKYVMEAIVESVKEASSLGVKEALTGLGVVIGGLLGLAVALLVMKKAQKGAVALTIAAAGLYILGQTLTSLASLSWEDLAKGLVGLVGGIAALGGAAALLGPVAPTMMMIGLAMAFVGASILEASAGFALFVDTLERIGDMKPAKIQAILDNVATMIPEVMTAVGNGVVAFVKVLADNYQELLRVWGDNLEVLIDVVLDLVERFLIDLLKVCKKLVAPIVDLVIYTCMAILKGLEKAAQPLMDAVMQILVNILKGIKDNIREVVELVLDICVEIVEGIVAKTDDVVAAIVHIISALLEAIGEHFPDLLLAGTNMIANFIQGMVEGISDIITMAVTMITTFLDALNENVMTLAEGLRDFVVDAINNLAEFIRDTADKMHEAFMNLGMAIIDSVWYSILGKERVEKLKKIGKNMISKIIKGIFGKKDDAADAGTSIGSSITGSFGNIGDTFKDIGKNIVNGLIDGIKSLGSKVKETAQGLGESIKETVEDFFDINSPSKVMAKDGGYIMEGVVVGMNSMRGSLENATIAAGNTVLDAMAESIKQASEIVDANADMSPTIRPVLDLSSVQNGSKQIASMADSWKDITFGGSNERAFAAVATAKAAKRSPSDDTVDAINALGKKLDAKDDRVSTFTNTFNIKSTDPKAAADEVSRIIAKQVERKDAVWA